MRRPKGRSAGAGRLSRLHGARERHLAALRRIAGADDWLIVAVQGLHRFCDPKHQSVVASWMTSQDRELAIADNLAYVGAVVDQVTRDHDTARPFVYAGFSHTVADE